MFDSFFLSTLKIAFEEGAKYMPYVLAGTVMFRLAHFPDIGIQGTFALGACSMPLALMLGLPVWFGFIISILCGILGGILTGTLFVRFRLNSLICGIVTAFVAYSLCFLLLGFKSVASFPVILNENQVGLLGLLFGAVMCLFFSTRYGLSYRIAGESPDFLMQLGVSPHSRLLILLVLGNCIAAIAGSLVVCVKGSVNVRIGDFMVFQAIICLVLGEGVLSVAIALYKRISRNQSIVLPKKLERFRMVIQAAFSGTGAVYPILAAILGSFCYFLIFNLCTAYVVAGDFTRLVLGLATAILLIVGSRISKRYHRFSSWTFHGYIK